MVLHIIHVLYYSRFFLHVSTICYYTIVFLYQCILLVDNILDVLITHGQHKSGETVSAEFSSVDKSIAEVKINCFESSKSRRKAE